MTTKWRVPLERLPVAIARSRDEGNFLRGFGSQFRQQQEITGPQASAGAEVSLLHLRIVGQRRGGAGQNALADLQHPGKIRDL